MIPEPPL
jgi:hypothetical protein